MGKKKKGGKKGGKKEVKKRFILGKMEHSLRIGIVGLPNTGKSTIFNALTDNDVPANNFPFCTTDKNLGVCVFEDPRFTHLEKAFKPPKAVHAVLNVVDIAGLVKGAHNGDGLGNEFLGHIRDVDAIYHVVRVFNKKNISHVEGSIDPIRDMEIIQNELRQKDIMWLDKTIKGLIRPAKASKDKARELATAQKVCDMLKEDPPRDPKFHSKWDSKEMEYLNQWRLFSAKPALYLVNMSPKSFRSEKGSKHMESIKKYVEEYSQGMESVMGFSGIFEKKISKLKPEKRQAFCEECKCFSAIPQIIRQGYDLLDLHHFFTHNDNEMRQWTLKRGTTVVKAAGRIHGDFEKTFINAECYSFSDFEKHGSEAELRSKGLMKVQGKSYVVNDGDVVMIRAGCQKK